MACVIVQEGLYDSRFLAEHTVGFEDWTDSNGVKRPGFKRFLEEACDLAALSTASDVHEDTIRRLAREFANARPGLALAARGRLSDQMVVHALNGLVGSFGPGGMITCEGPLPLEIGAEQAAQPPAESIPDLAFSRPERVQALVLDRVNPAFSSPSPQRWRRALEHIPFVVALSSFVDESAYRADVVLPICTGLESWSATARSTYDGAEVLSVSAPAIKPLYESRPAADVILEIARHLGGKSAAALYWTDAEHVLREHLGRLAEKGWVPLPAGAVRKDEPLEFFENGVSAGGWVRRGHSLGTAFSTASGKFQFFSEDLAKTEPGGRWAGLPRWAGPPVTCTTTYPLYLEISSPAAYPEGQGGHIPFLASIIGSYLNAVWETWIEINPATAKRFDLEDGDWAIVATEAGDVRGRVRWHSGIRPDVISMPLGLGHDTFGGPLKGVGSNPAHLIPSRLCPASGNPVWLAAASIRKEA